MLAGVKVSAALVHLAWMSTGCGVKVEAPGLFVPYCQSLGNLQFTPELGGSATDGISLRKG